MQAAGFTMNAFRTDFYTGKAVSTLVGNPGKLRFSFYPFGIMTPSAFEGTTFKKYGCSNARSIVNGEGLDIENVSIHGFLK
jgi:hypothetical protein